MPLVTFISMISPLDRWWDSNPLEAADNQVYMYVCITICIMCVGTNDKSGAVSYVYKWASAQSIKETFVPMTTWGYPSVDED